MNTLHQPFYKKFIGDKAFYSMVLSVTIPIMLQSGVSNFVNLLDNIMVGRVGTEQMTGVAIANQLFFVFNLCIFGANAGAGIFTTQYYGRGDNEAVRATFRYKMYISAVISVLGLLIFGLFGRPLIQLYLNGQSVECDAAAAMDNAMRYMRVMMIGLIPFAFSQVYAGTLRETGQTVFPMKVSFVAVTVNLVFNWIFIFGNLGAPKMGVVGAAVATVMSRFVEVFITIFWTHKRTDKNPYIVGLFKSMKIPKAMAIEMFKKGTPLLANECLWAVGCAVVTQCFSVRGLEVVAAYNISSTIMNFFNVVSLSLGNAIAIIVGHKLGAALVDEAKDYVRKLLFFAVVCCIAVGIIMVIFAGAFADFYNTTDHIKGVARSFIMLLGGSMPLCAFVNGCYFTLRSGGKTIITFIFDCGFMWVIMVPITYILANYTALSPALVFFCMQYTEAVKCIVGYILVKKGVWIRTFN